MGLATSEAATQSTTATRPSLTAATLATPTLTNSINAAFASAAVAAAALATAAVTTTTVATATVTATAITAAHGPTPLSTSPFASAAGGALERGRRRHVTQRSSRIFRSGCLRWTGHGARPHSHHTSPSWPQPQL